MNESFKKIDTESRESLADRVQRCRHALKMTKAELASSAGLPRAPMTRFEKKQNKDMSIGTLKKLTGALGVSADYLAGRRDEEAYFKNPQLQKLIKNMKQLKAEDLQCIHELYLVLLEKHR